MAKKKIIILGGIGKTERENRDDMRVVFRGVLPNLKSSYRTRPAFGNQKMEKGLIVQGTMDNTHDGSHEIANRVYFRGGCCPTITTGGNVSPKTIKKYEKDGKENDSCRLLKHNGL